MSETLRDLPTRVIVGANGAYWRDYGDHYSMCPVSEDNDPVEIVASYNLARSESPSPGAGLDVALLTKALTEALSAMDDEWIVSECAEYAAAEYARLRSSADSGPEGA